jgi:hypothetical protein
MRIMSKPEKSLSWRIAMKRWMMRLAMLLAFMTGAACAQDLTGNWQGTLQMGKGVRLVLKVAKSPDGNLKGQVYTVDQPSPPLAVTDIALKGQM